LAVEVVLRLTVTPLSVEVPNPVLEAVKVYIPGGRFENRYSPSLFAAAELLIFVPSLVTATAALGTPAPDGS
jgi:hypothetical protein